MSGHLRIIIADDEQDTRNYFQFILTRLGHEVTAVADGRELVDVCREFEPDLVVTDYAMPGLNGLAAALEVNREHPVPVILISGRQDLDLTDAMTSRLSIRCLPKPVREATLISAVQAAAAELNAGTR